LYGHCHTTESEFVRLGKEYLIKNLEEAIMRFRIRAYIVPLLIGILTIFPMILFFVDDGNSDESRSAGQPSVGVKEQKFGPDDIVTPVHGPSWLKQIGIFDIRLTPMGKMGGYNPPLPSPRKEPYFPVEGVSRGGRMGMGMGGMLGRSRFNYRSAPSEIERLMGESFFLAGIDLYRLNCQSCHGPNGKGIPPEINSLIGPFQLTSPALIEERAKKSGKQLAEDVAKELASQTEENILHRLQNGGNKMPPFRRLKGKEVNALMQYLKRHAGVPESQGKDILVQQTVPRVGEHLMKGTCHICHDAAGPGSGHMGMMMGGIIPSLASFPWEQSMQSLVWQVELGSRTMMMMGDPRMPAYPYITANETAASYLYLVKYPPY
jgi:mono/diheme cytochrome c family protein